MVKAAAMGETNPDGGSGSFMGIGLHHFVVNSAKQDDGNPNNVIVNIGSLASLIPELDGDKKPTGKLLPGQSGRDRTDYFDLTDKHGVGRLVQLAIALGVRTKEQWDASVKAHKEGRPQPVDELGRELDDIPIEEFGGRQGCCEVIDASFTAEKDSQKVDDSGAPKFKKGDRVFKTEIGYRYYRLIDETVKKKFALDLDAANVAIQFQYPGAQPGGDATAGSPASAGPAPGTPNGPPAARPAPVSSPAPAAVSKYAGL